MFFFSKKRTSRNLLSVLGNFDNNISIPRVDELKLVESTDQSGNKST